MVRKRLVTVREGLVTLTNRLVTMTRPLVDVRTRPVMVNKHSAATKRLANLCEGEVTKRVRKVGSGRPGGEIVSQLTT
jgi:hypothetical protein